VWVPPFLRLVLVVAAAAATAAIWAYASWFAMKCVGETLSTMKDSRTRARAPLPERSWFMSPWTFTTAPTCSRARSDSRSLKTVCCVFFGFCELLVLEVVCSYFDSQRHGGWLDASDQLAGLDIDGVSFAVAA